MSVVVIGAGVIGLSCALEVAERGLEVRVVAEHTGPDTTSWAAGAMVAGSPDADRRKAAWIQATERRLAALAGQPGTGVSIQPAIVASRAGLVAPDTPGYVAGPDLPRGFESGSGIRQDITYVAMPAYLGWLTERLAAQGVQIEQRRVASFDELDARVVVNATGWEAGALTGDQQIVANRGQHVVLTDPGLSYGFWEHTEGREWISWMIHDGVAVCGGLAGGQDHRREPDPVIAEQILARLRAAEPLFHDAQILEHRVGFRPHRAQVRLEAERRPAGRGSVEVVVHCYGHGGNGVAWSIGSAIEVADLIAGVGKQS